MAVIFTEGFDWIGTNAANADVQAFWGYATGMDGVSATGKDTIGKALTLASTDCAITDLGANEATVIVQLAIKFSSFGSQQTVLRFFDSGGYSATLNGANEQVYVEVNTSGYMVFTKNGSALVTATTGQMTTGVWYYWKIKITFNDSGSIVASVGSTEVVNGSYDTTKTANANCRYFGIGKSNSGSTFTIDDIIVMNTSGSYNNDFIAEHSIKTIWPTGDGTPLQWTPSTGTTHYTLVDDANNIVTTDYVSSSTATDRDQWTMGNLSTSPYAIAGLVLKWAGAKDDAGARGVKGYIKSSSSESLSADKTLSTTTAGFLHVVERDPNGTIAWTGSGVDGISIGVETT